MARDPAANHQDDPHGVGDLRVDVADQLLAQISVRDLLYFHGRKADHDPGAADAMTDLSTIVRYRDWSQLWPRLSEKR